MLSFKIGKPFAIIRGGKKNNKVLKIHDNTDKDKPIYEVPQIN